MTAAWPRDPEGIWEPRTLGARGGAAAPSTGRGGGALAVWSRGVWALVLQSGERASLGSPGTTYLLQEGTGRRCKCPGSAGETPKLGTRSGGEGHLVVGHDHHLLSPGPAPTLSSVATQSWP